MKKIKLLHQHRRRENTAAVNYNIRGHNIMAEKLAIAMSGGVDSSVAALLTKETGDECIGATMKLFHNEVCSYVPS